MDPANWKERIRAVSERFFDLAGFPSSRRNQAPYRLSNDVQRSLAHLAGFDGGHSRLLRALESGVLRVSSEGSAQRPFSTDSSGKQYVRLFLGATESPITAPTGCLVVTPSAEVVQETGHGSIDEGVSDELDLGSTADRIVEISLGEGGTDPVVTVGARATSAGANINLYHPGKGFLGRVQWEWQYMFVSSVTHDSVITVRWWDL